MKETLEVQLDDEEPEISQGRISRQSLERFLFQNRWMVVSGLIGLVLVGFGFFFFRAGVFEGNKIEILESGRKDGEAALAGDSEAKRVIVEISGAVEKPGVYKLLASERLERLLIEAGGLSAQADREWIEKNLNRAAKITDGQKIYVPSKGELGIRNNELGKTRPGSVAGTTSGLLNINTASASELDGLPGIGAVRAQAIIDNRPYSSPEELLGKKVIPQSVYEKIKDKIIAP